MDMYVTFFFSEGGLEEGLVIVLTAKSKGSLSIILEADNNVSLKTSLPS